MSKNEKLIRKVENYMSGDSISFKELEKYLLLNGFSEKPQNGTSHIIFTHALIDRPLVIPKHGNNVKGAYVKQAVVAVMEIHDCEGDE